MNDIDLVAWLERDEAGSRPSRARRLRFLIEQYGEPEHRVFFGGPVSAQAFEETRQAYLHGLFLSTSVMAQVCLEHLLGGLLRMAGHEIEGKGFAGMLEAARDERFISDVEFGLFDRLRRTRNPYVHARSPSSPSHIMRRAIETDTPFEDLIAQDAEEAIQALCGISRRRPFAIGESDES